MSALKNPHGIAALLLLSFAGCSSDTPAAQHVQLASLGFDVPAGWQHTANQRHGIVSGEWRPEENDAKESLVVIRTEMASIAGSDRAAALDKAVATLQQGFNHAEVGKPSHVRTRGGFEGVSIDTDFEPPGVKGRYHREHVVLVDASGSALIHVLYTARTPDPKRIGLQMVLDTIRHQEA